MRGGTMSRTYGWAWPGLANKAHLFPSDEIRSLCGRWGYTGQRENVQATAQDAPGYQDCAACWRKAKKLGVLPGAVSA